MSGPSEKAVEAVAHRMVMSYGAARSDVTLAQARRLVAAAHNPDLGLDRSVCLRDVADWIRRAAPVDAVLADDVAEELEREFGGGA